MKSIELLAATLLAAAPVAALQEPRPEPAAEVQVSTGRRVVPADELVGTNVLNLKDETLATIEDLVIHPSGEIAFYVVSGAGWTGAESKLVPVPSGAVMRDVERGVLRLDTTAEKLRESRGFQKDEWPELDDTDYWSAAAKSFQGLQKKQASPVEAAAKLAPTKRLYRYAELVGHALETPGGEEVGKIRAVAVDERSHGVSFVVIGTGGFLSSGEKLVAVPWIAIEPMPDESNRKLVRLTLATTKEQLEGAPEFEAGEAGWKQASDPGWIVRLYQFYGVTPAVDVDVDVDVDESPGGTAGSGGR